MVFSHIFPSADSRFEIVSNKMVLKQSSYLMTKESVQVNIEPLHRPPPEVQQRKPLQNSNGGGHGGGFIMPLPYPVASPVMPETTEVDKSGYENQEDSRSSRAILACAVLASNKQDEMKGPVTTARGDPPAARPVLLQRSMPVPESCAQSDGSIETPPTPNVVDSSRINRNAVSTASFLPPHLAAAMKAAQKRQSGKSCAGAPVESTSSPSPAAASAALTARTPTQQFKGTAPVLQDAYSESHKPSTAPAAPPSLSFPSRNQMPNMQQKVLQQPQPQLYMSGAERFLAANNIYNIQYTSPGVSGEH
jgi:hypothetical protein